VNKSCFLAPIHSPKFDEGSKLIESYNKHFNDDHIYLIFSSEEDEKEFKTKNKKLKYRSIVNQRPVNYGVITQKKYSGLIEIFKQDEFDKVGVIDVDSLFFRNIDYDALFEYKVKQNTLYANLIQQRYYYLSEPLKFFTNPEKQKLCDILSYGLISDEVNGNTMNVFFWFNDIPVYSKSNFTDFLEYINYEENWIKINSQDFDYIVYGFYLLLHKSAKLKMLNFNDDAIYCKTCFIESQEFINEPIFQSVYSSYNPMWIKNEINTMNNTFLKVHTDR
jgi:hypothetical protein